MGYGCRRGGGHGGRCVLWDLGRVSFSCLGSLCSRPRHWCEVGYERLFYGYNFNYLVGVAKRNRRGTAKLFPRSLNVRQVQA